MGEMISINYGLGTCCHSRELTSTNLPVLILCGVWSYFEDDFGTAGPNAEHRSI